MICLNIFIIPSCIFKKLAHKVNSTLSKIYRIFNNQYTKSKNIYYIYDPSKKLKQYISLFFIPLNELGKTI